MEQLKEKSMDVKTHYVIVYGGGSNAAGTFYHFYTSPK
jgi:tryptophan synthase beta subunit